MLEMLHRIGNEDLRAGDIRLGQGLVEYLPGRTDEWLAGEILLVAWLLAHQHQMSMPAPFARDGLRRILVERTARAEVLGLGQLGQGFDGGSDIKFELGFVLHRATPSTSPFCVINAPAPSQFSRGRRRAPEHIKKSLYPYCGAPTALL